MSSKPRLDQLSPRALGAYYTPDHATDFMVEWLLGGGAREVLEPSFGDGAFLAAVSRVAGRLGVDPMVSGVEIAEDTFTAVIEGGLIPQARAMCADFLAVEPFPVDGVIGNPPYVRLRHLPESAARQARQVASAVSGAPMDPAGSLWMPFVLHSTRFLRPGGRLALVLPLDATYVRYGRPLWAFLGRNFGSLEVIRSRERLFPSILQDVVLLLASDFGSATRHVDFRAVESAADLDSVVPRPVQVPIAGLADGDRAFTDALLGEDVRQLIESKITPHSVPSSHLMKCRIGYVCGDKAFFHPTRDVVQAHDIPESSLIPALVSGRQVGSQHLITSELADSQMRTLWQPAGQLSPGERTYVQSGIEAGVDQRYKCRIRSPWYVTPGVQVADVVIPVFSNEPCLMLNDGNLVATNSFLCGWAVDSVTPTDLVAAWYSSLTLLQLELEVHSLGGGVMVLVPNEVNQLLMPSAALGSNRHTQEVAHHLAHSGRRGAFEYGDNLVLREFYGLSASEIDLVRCGVDTLRSWRGAGLK